MSDPVTNVEIEDILSSIRRLVSDEGKPAADAGEGREEGKLVLTPSLRVPGAEDGRDDHAPVTTKPKPMTAATDDQDTDHDRATGTGDAPGMAVAPDGARPMARRTMARCRARRRRAIPSRAARICARGSPRWRIGRHPRRRMGTRRIGRR